MNEGRRVVLVTIVLVLLLLTCVLPALVDILLALTFGWAFYLTRVLPRVTVSPSGLATAAVCLALFTAGLHRFLSWLRAEARGPGAEPWRWKWTGAVVAGVVLMFTAGLAATGVVHQVGWLVNSSERWVLPRSSGAEMRARSINNLKRTWFAVADYEGVEGAFPPGLTVGEFGVLLHSWQGVIAPFNEVPHAAEIDWSRPWDHPVNLPIVRQTVLDYRHPGLKDTHDAAGFPLSHYEGNSRVLGGPRSFREQDVPDGLSTTIYAGEVAGAFRPWARPGPGRDPADGINRDPSRGFGGPSVGGANVLLMDGSVRFLKNTINPAVLKALSTPAGKDAVSPDTY